MIHHSPFPDVDVPDVSLPAFVLAAVEDRPDKPALIDGPSGRTLTYGQLAGAVARVASGLAARGFTKGDVLAIVSPNLPEFAVIFFAVTSRGGVVTTANPRYTADELHHQLVDAGATVLVTIPPLVDTARLAIRETAVRELVVFGEADGATPFSALLADGVTVDPAVVDPGTDVAVLPYSSGTTGLPKGVMLTHRNLVANLAQLDALEPHVAVSIGVDDVVLGLLPFFHIYGMTVILAYGLHKGATIVTLPRFDLEQFLTVIQEHRVTYVNVVPPIVQALAKHPLVDHYDLSSLREVGSGAAPLGRDIAHMAAERIGCGVVQGYGMTELSPVSHVNPDQHDQIDTGSVGPAIPGTESRLVDVETGDDVAVGEPGELLVRGPQVMRGYLNNPDATAATIDDDGWLHTGDIATIDDRGYVTIVDRVKELIKYKGFQVAPAELEALLLTHDAVADAAVIGRPDEEAGEIPIAFIVAAGGELDPDELLAFVADRIAPHKRVRGARSSSTSPSRRRARSCAANSADAGQGRGDPHGRTAEHQPGGVEARAPQQRGRRDEQTNGQWIDQGVAGQLDHHTGHQADGGGVDTVEQGRGPGAGAQPLDERADGGDEAERRYEDAERRHDGAG
ncbi:4-coumarate--CoA ligase family protein [soil metagenome]